MPPKSRRCAAQAVRFLQERYGITPCLAVLLVGDDPASQVYVRGKANDCEACGIKSRVIRLPAGTTQAELLARLGTLAADSAVHGILVQLPLPRHIDPAAVIEAIPPEKDVDGFTPVNAGRLLNGEPCFAPCTPAGCLRMIEAAGVDLDGKHAVVVGRSNIVGKPAALLLMQKNATVTVCHSHTRDLAVRLPHGRCPHCGCRQSQVHHGRYGQARRGRHRRRHQPRRGRQAARRRRLCPRVRNRFLHHAVPGGVGLMTRAMLMLNTVQAAAPKTAGDLGFSVKKPGCGFDTRILYTASHKKSAAPLDFAARMWYAD